MKQSCPVFFTPSYFSVLMMCGIYGITRGNMVKVYILSHLVHNVTQTQLPG